MDCADEALRGLGYSVGRNKPYAGGYITEHYGNPDTGFHVIQIEINRSIYMNERDFTLLPAFDRLKQDLVVLRDALAALPFHYLDAFHLAAE
jgi:N-formylglutamate deformylase